MEEKTAGEPLPVCQGRRTDSAYSLCNINAHQTWREIHRSNFWSRSVLEPEHRVLPNFQRCLLPDLRLLYQLNLLHRVDHHLEFDRPEPTFQNAPAEIPDNDPAPQISISRGVHRWPLCFAIRHAVNAKSVVKLLVCHGEFCFCVKLKVVKVARPKCKVTNFTFTPACTIERFDLFYMAFHAWPSLK